jgi:hypothetical protein
VAKSVDSLAPFIAGSCANPQSWVRYAKFELGNGEVALARRCYERAVEELGEDAQTVGCAELGDDKQRLGPGGVFDPLEVSAVTQ